MIDKFFYKFFGILDKLCFLIDNIFKPRKKKKMNLADLLKKNIVMVPVVASVLVGTFTGVKYIVNLTDTINGNQAQIRELKTMELENIQRDMKVLTDNVNTVIAKLERAEGTWEMAENLYEVLADKVRQMEYDIKDLNREINY